jgi:hypothetical protein
MPTTKLTALAIALLPAQVLAHEGHGKLGAHWHATDVWSYVIVAGVVALCLWIASRR